MSANVNPRLTLDAIQSLVEAMPASIDRDRWINYATIKTLVDELWAHARARGVPAAAAQEKISQLLNAAAQVAGLEPEQPHSLDQALRAITSLRSLIKWNHDQQRRVMERDE